MSQTNVINVPEQSKNIFIAVADGTTTEKLADKININVLQNATGWILWLYHNYKANNNSILSEKLYPHPGMSIHFNPLVKRSPTGN